jgi:hypothetical protein
MRRSFLLGLVPALAFAAVTFGGARKAQAGPHLDIDFDLGTALQNRNNQTAVDFSGGLGLRLGWRAHLYGAPLYIQPEIGGKYMHFGFNSNNVQGGYDYAGIVNAGLKFGMTGIVQPNIFGHLGYGFMGYTDPGANNNILGVSGPTADIGAGLDFRLLPGWTLGLQVAYNSMLVPVDNTTANSDITTAKWVSFGLTTGFHFMEPRPVPVYVRPAPVYVRAY